MSPVDIHRHLAEVYGVKCMCVQHVRKWRREFSAGRKEVHDEEQVGSLSVSEAVVEMVQRGMLQNRRIAVRELAARIPGSPYGTVEKALEYHKCCARQFMQKCQENKEGLLDSIVREDES
ncbi:hypothetical protein RI129_009661 [Pyrocoelia pectoralis]|uniref:Transposase n=1 Tax=Pyrocoelia pectoralis TaxID=417401 RepID=A0AAN7VC14_9COLE